jgi:hypothetical protein
MADSNYVAYLQRTVNVVDGFSLNSAVYPLPYVYQGLCIGAMGPIRQANNYKPKIYAIPDQSVFGLGVANPNNSGMTPFSDYVTQTRVVPGTLVLGITIAMIVWEAGSITPPFGVAAGLDVPNNLYINVTDDATGIPFFSSWLADIAFNVPILWNSTGPQNVPDYVTKTAWLPLTKPRPILSPGIITVEMCLKSYIPDRNVSPQVILQCAEPCGNAEGPNQGDCK